LIVYTYCILVRMLWLYIFMLIYLLVYLVLTVYYLVNCMQLSICLIIAIFMHNLITITMLHIII